MKPVICDNTCLGSSDSIRNKKNWPVQAKFAVSYTIQNTNAVKSYTAKGRTFFCTLVDFLQWTAEQADFVSHALGDFTVEYIAYAYHERPVLKYSRKLFYEGLLQ